jgi:hypothetical protein
MKRVWASVALALFALVWLVGCQMRDPSPMGSVPSRLLYSSSPVGKLWTMCDKGHRLYLTQPGYLTTHRSVEIVPYGCPDGIP